MYSNISDTKYGSVLRYGEKVQFVPITNPPCRFKLHLRHLFPEEYIPANLDAAAEREFEIIYGETDLRRAVIRMMKRKRVDDETSGRDVENEKITKRIKKESVTRNSKSDTVKGNAGSSR